MSKGNILIQYWVQYWGVCKPALKPKSYVLANECQQGSILPKYCIAPNVGQNKITIIWTVMFGLDTTDAKSRFGIQNKQLVYVCFYLPLSQLEIFLHGQPKLV